jgi:sulfur carrier protein
MNAIIQVNGEPEPLSVTTVEELVCGKSEQSNRRGLAVALNGAVVRRTEWARTVLQPGDRVEIVRVLQGG